MQATFSLSRPTIPVAESVALDLMVTFNAGLQRFPRSIREENTLYFVDEVLPGPDGGSYIACGKIHRLVQ
jgi:hypothetical protein